jgi:DivIVA domain-containing protein
MATVLLVLVVVMVVAALIFGVVSLISGDDPGLGTAEPDGRALPLPNTRSLTESDLKTVRFDVSLRGYRMAQVDRVLRRTAYDIGYKDEMIAVLDAEVIALREGRLKDADMLRQIREAAAKPGAAPADGRTSESVKPLGAEDTVPAGHAISDHDGNEHDGTDHDGPVPGGTVHAGTEPDVTEPDVTDHGAADRDASASGPTGGIPGSGDFTRRPTIGHTPTIATSAAAPSDGTGGGSVRAHDAAAGSAGSAGSAGTDDSDEPTGSAGSAGVPERAQRPSHA